MKMYLNRTMFLRLVLYSLVIVGLANLIMGSMTYFYFQKTIRDREIQSSRDTLNQSRRMVEMTISEIQKKTTAISENVGVLKVLGHPLGEISYDAIRSVVDHLDNEITSSNYLHSIYLYNERVGKVITNEGIIDYEYFWDRKAIEQMQRYPFYQSWVEPRTISNIGGISMNVMTYALRLPGDGVFNNYIIMNSRMSFFYQPVIDNAAPPNQEFIIYNSEGKVMIYDDRSKRTEALGGLLQELPRDSAKGWFLRDMDGTRLFVSFIRSEYNQWTYMKASSVAETFKESRLILGVVLLITMVCLVIGAVLAFFMSNRYYRPIAHLVQAVAGNRSNPAAKRTDDLSLLHSTFDELITTNRQFEEDLKRHQEVIKEHFLLGLLLGRENDAEDIREKIEYYGLPLPDTPYMVWIVHVHPPLHSPHGNHVVLDHARTVGINRSVDEYCRESATGAYVWLDHDDLALLVSCRPATEGTLEVGSKELAKRLVEHIQSQTGIAVTVAIGGVRESLYEAHSSYSEATEALAYQNFADISGIISGQDVRTRHGSSNEWVEFNQLTEQLKAELKLGHSSRAEAILQKLFEILSAKEGMNFLERQLLLNQLVYSVIICMGEINPSLRDVYDGNPYADFREMHTIGEIHHWLHQTVRQTVTYVMTRKENKQVERIEHVYRYVQEHYMDDVTLQTMADKLYMNPQYFSKWFRDLTGKPYVEYVTEIRLEAALKMLETHNAKVYEIAEKTGFGNRINFIRAFKKHYGKTPSDYRAGMFLSDHEPEKDGT